MNDSIVRRGLKRMRDLVGAKPRSAGLRLGGRQLQQLRQQL